MTKSKETLKKSTTKTHFDKYELLLDGSKRFLKSWSKEFVVSLGGVEVLKEIFEKDPLLTSFNTSPFYKAFILDRDKYSNAEQISLLKHYLIFHLLKATPIWIDKPYLHLDKDVEAHNTSKS